MQQSRVSVLLPVHQGVDPAHFREAAQSILDQTRPADEIVIVEDGPLDAGHHEVIDLLRTGSATVIVERLPVNQGAGVANQAGLTRATGDWIAKADADDINLPTRLERQLALAADSDADVWGAAMGEFSDDPNMIEGVRTNPLTHEAILRRMRWNNPVNHPTAFFTRTGALAAGGYPRSRYMQDYDLFARMAARGATFENSSAVLVLFRADAGMYVRRRAMAMMPLEWRLQKKLCSYGLICWPRSVLNFSIRSTFRLLPVRFMRYLHRILFRREVAS